WRDAGADTKTHAGALSLGVSVEPIQLQCGSCGQMMAISPEHQGAQVQCPHCKAVVQTPAPAPPLGQAPAPAPVPGPLPQFNVGDQDSIFGQPEPLDDLFGAAPAPKIEMPPPVEVAPQPARLSAATATV